MASKPFSAGLKRYFLLLLSSATLIKSQVAIPYPNGTAFGTALVTGQLTDENRLDPWAPTSHARKLMVSIFYPVPHEQCATLQQTPYMPPATAAFLGSQLSLPNGSFEALNLQHCKPSSSCNLDLHRFPVVVYSPGFTSSRLLSSGLAQAVASAGYVVVMMDHPYDAAFVEFPDGDKIPTLPALADRIDEAVHVRVTDTQFVLNTLSTKGGLRTLLPSAVKGLNVKHTAMFGHSLGGATSVAVMFNETRILGGFDLDGTLFGLEKSKTISKNRSVMLFGTPTHNSTDDITWKEGLAQVTGWKREVVLADSGHNTFTDGPRLIKLLGMQGKLGPVLEAQLGKLDGDRAHEIITTYVIAFMDFVLRHIPSAILNTQNPAFAEVTYPIAV